MLGHAYNLSTWEIKSRSIRSSRSSSAKYIVSQSQHGLHKNFIVYPHPHPNLFNVSQSYLLEVLHEFGTKLTVLYNSQKVESIEFQWTGEWKNKMHNMVCYSTLR